MVPYNLSSCLSQNLRCCKNIFFLEFFAILKIAFLGELVWIFEMSASPLKYKAKKKFYLSIDQLKEQNENDDMTMVEFEVSLKQNSYAVGMATLGHTA